MKRLLVFRFSAMGDVAMTVPVLYALVKQYPDLQITIVSREAFRPFFEKLPANISFITADLYGKHKGIRGLYRLFRELSPSKFDAVADLHDVLRTFFLRFCFRLTGIPVEHINKGRKEKKALTRQQNKKCIALTPTCERYANVFRKLGLSFPLEFTTIYETEQPDRSTFIQHTGEKGDFRWVGIAPFAKHVGKMYPLSKMEEVIVELSRQEKIKLFLFGGGKEEIETLAAWEKKYPNTTALAGKLKLNGELALISQLDVMISMDSANMHMASLTNTPVVSIWGATHPWGGFLGWNQSAANIIQTDLPCRPCSIFGHKPCIRQDYACLNRITPQSIISHTLKVLNSTASH